MLYVTTRNHRDTFTTAHALTENRGADGGLYLPMQFPRLSKEEWREFVSLSFNQRVAELLNRFFNTRLTGWDIDFCIGRYPVRVEQPAYKILLAETWHNPQWQYRRLEKNLTQLLETDADAPGSCPGCQPTAVPGGQGEDPEKTALKKAPASTTQVLFQYMQQ